MLQMTRQQYQQKYGGTSTNTTPVTNTPITMTRQQYAQKYGVQPGEEKSVSGFLGNVIKSGGRLIGDTASAAVNAFNPNMEKNTVANMMRLGQGIGQKIDPTKGNKIADFSNKATALMFPPLAPFLNLENKNYEPQAQAVGDFYKQRYGGVKNIANTAYTDPVGMAADAATVLMGVGGALKGGAGLAGKSSQLARAGETAAAVGEAVDPIMAATKATGAVGSKLFSRVRPNLLIRADEMVTAGIGNPRRMANAERKAGRSTASFMKEYNLFDRSPETAKQVVKDIGEKFDTAAMQSGKKLSTSQIVKAFDDKITELSQTNNGVMADATRQQIAELTRRKQMFLDSIISDASSPLNISLDQATTFRRNVIDPDVPKSEFGLSPKETGKAGGVKSARDIFRRESISVAPELEKLGLDYGMAKELEKILTDSASRGKNRRLFNFTKMGGGGLGGLIAGAPGVVAGFTLEQIVNNPRFIATASEGLKKALNAKLNVPQPLRFGANSLYQLGRAGRMTNVN